MESYGEYFVQKEEESLKASIRRESSQRRIRDKSHGRGVSRGYLEGELEADSDADDENAFSLSAIKNKFKPGAKKGILSHWRLRSACQS